MDILSICFGILICGVGFLFYNLGRFTGYLRIDTTDPEKDYYLIDITKDLNKLSKRRTIILKIDTKFKKSP